MLGMMMTLVPQKHRNHRKNTYTHRLHLKCFWFLFSLSLSLVHLFNFNLCNMIALNGAFRWILFHFIWLWASFDGPHNSSLNFVNNVLTVKRFWLAKKRRHIQPVRCQVCEFPQVFFVWAYIVVTHTWCFANYLFASWKTTAKSSHHEQTIKISK